MPKGYWVYDPNSGGQKIPPIVQQDVEKRIRAVAESEYKGRYTRLEIRFKSQFCYIDAYTEPVLMDNCPLHLQPREIRTIRFPERRIYRQA